MADVFTDIEIIANDFTIHELTNGSSLAVHIKSVLDSKLYPTYEEAIDSVVSVKDPHSLISYAISKEHYEAAALIKRLYQEILIKQ